MTQPSDAVGENLAKLRKQRGLSTRALSDRLEAMGHRIANSSLSKIEQGARIVDADDLVALALALGTTPAWLVSRDSTDPDELVHLTPKVAVPADRAWGWAQGRWPLPAGHYANDATSSWVVHDFLQHSRPADVQVRDLLPAVRAAQDLIDELGGLADAMADKPAEEELQHFTEDELGRAAAEVARALARVTTETTDMLRRAVERLPTVYRVERPDKFTGVKAGVRFTGGISAVHEREKEALQQFRAEGCVIEPVSVEERLEILLHNGRVTGRD